MSLKIGKVNLITLTEAERTFKVSRMTLLRAIKRGELKGFSIAQRTLVKPEEVKRWIETRYNREMARRAFVRWQQHHKGRKKRGALDKPLPSC